MRRMALSALTLLSIFVAGTAAAQLEGLFIYPGNNQTKEQQQKDESECSGWATQQSGFDPLRASVSNVPPADEPRGGVVSGAAKGAALGAIGGAIAGDAGKGAAVGAGVGAAGGGLRQRQQRKGQQAAQGQAVAKQQKGETDFRRAFSTCMEARNYTVK